MTDKNLHTTGRFVWHELHTSDPRAAAAFYGELLGWKTRSMDMGPGGAYTIITAGDKDVGGIVPLDTSRAPRSNWLPYCTAVDVDAAAATAAAKGGQVLMGAMDIPTVGRFAVVRDPQGGVIAPFRMSEEYAETDDRPAPWTFCWDEHLSGDPAAALSFYQAIFGWKDSPKEMGPAGTYHVLERGKRQAAGLAKQADGMPTVWLSHVLVDDLDEASQRAARLGAKTLVPVVPVPEIGRFSVIADPTGAGIALFQGSM